MPERDYRQLDWRTGRKLVRTLYAVTSDNWEDHPLIGVMDTPELATEAMLCHNHWLADVKRTEPKA